MDINTEKSLLLSEISAYLTVIEDRGLTVDIPDDEAMRGMSLSDIRKVLNHVKSVSRTPPNR